MRCGRLFWTACPRGMIRRGDLATSLDKIGDVFLALADPKAALRRFKTEVALLEKLVAKEGGVNQMAK